MMRKLLRYHSFPAKNNRRLDSFVAWLIVKVAGLFSGSYRMELRIWCLLQGLALQQPWFRQESRLRFTEHVARPQSGPPCCWERWRAHPHSIHSCCRATHWGLVRGGAEWIRRMNVVIGNKSHSKNFSSSAQIQLMVWTPSDRSWTSAFQVSCISTIDWLYLQPCDGFLVTSHAFLCQLYDLLKYPLERHANGWILFTEQVHRKRLTQYYCFIVARMASNYDTDKQNFS